MTTDNKTDNKTGEEAPAWLEELVEIVEEAYESESGVGWRWARSRGSDDGELFEVIVYPRLVEVQGETCAPSDVHVDVSAVLDLFESHDDVDLVRVNMSFGCTDGIDHLSVEGSVDGHDVWLRLLNDPPGDEVATVRFGDSGFFEPIAEAEHGSEGGEAVNPQQAFVDGALSRLRETHDLAREIARAWKVDRLAPSELLDRLAAHFAPGDAE